MGGDAAIVMCSVVHGSSAGTSLVSPGKIWEDEGLFWHFVDLWEDDCNKSVLPFRPRQDSAMQGSHRHSAFSVTPTPVNKSETLNKDVPAKERRADSLVVVPFEDLLLWESDEESEQVHHERFPLQSRGPTSATVEPPSRVRFGETMTITFGADDGE